MRWFTPAFASVLIAFASPLRAQIIRGRITEAESNRRLAAATIALVDPRGKVAASATTDTAGVFQLRAPQPGGYKLHFNLLGYTPVISEVIELRAHETIQLSAQLSTQPVPVTPLIVTARQRSRGSLDEFEKRRSQHTGGYFITQEDVEKHWTQPASALVLGVPGIALQNDIYDRNQIMLTGNGRTCRALLYVDGVPVDGSADDVLVSSWVGGVEVYPRVVTAPVQYQRGDNDCGVVLFWTREPETGGGWSWKKIAAAAGFVALVGAVAAH